MAVALAVAPAASAKTLTLNWVEQRSSAYYSEPMTFKVKDVVITKTAWAVHASFTNRSKVTLGIAPSRRDYYALYDFGLGWPTCTHASGSHDSCGRTWRSACAREGR